MRAGQFNMDEYLERLNEEAEKNNVSSKGVTVNQDGMVMPEENKKSFSWLKGEFQKGKVEVKVEMKVGNAKFEPGYDLQTDLKSVKEFKPSVLGQAAAPAKGKSGAPKETEEPKSPKNKKEETSAEEKEPKGAKEAPDKQDKKGDKSPKSQEMKLDVKNKKDGKK